MAPLRRLWNLYGVGTRLPHRVMDRYLNGDDFNGYGVHGLDVSTVASLIKAGKVDLVRGDGHPNPHIKAFAEEPVEEQLRKLAEQGLGEGCLYPTRQFLVEQRAGAAFTDRPFTQEMALGAPQLEFRVFDLRLLEFYRNDPRFNYEVDDVSGGIYRNPDHRTTEPKTVADGVELARFGFAFNEQMDRAIAIFLRDLRHVGAEEQRLMAGYQLKGDYKLHPGFYSSYILGEWPEKVSIYDAFLEEKYHINEMCRLMGKPALFKTDVQHPRPHGFGILLRSTNKEFRDFALLLNLLLTDDIDVAFFKGDIPTSGTVTDEAGNKRKSPIGTITLLQQWLSPPRFRPRDPEAMEALFKKLRNIRTVRARPAHIAEENTFDQVFLHQQRELMNDAYDVVRELRMYLENHPKVRGYTVPDYLRRGLVWTY
ncbi:hypothetical protein DevBK_07270 [Devosia sp. BK]|nr:hypothetical protein [Devosia sp. BK]